MKSICTLLLLFSLLTGTMAQAGTLSDPKLKKIKKRQAEYTLYYSVLEDDPATMHGPYRMQGKTWACEGEYAMGKRSGVWSFYGWNGKLDYQFDFTDNREVFSDRKSDSLDYQVKVYQDGQYVKRDVDSRAFYLGGDMRMQEFLARQIKYPSEARQKEAEGLAIIGVDISETGEMTGAAVAKGLNFGMQEEALRVVNLLPSEWVPAMVDGKPVRSKQYIPVRFEL